MYETRITPPHEHTLLLSQAASEVESFELVHNEYSAADPNPTKRREKNKYIHIYIRIYIYIHINISRNTHQVWG